MNVKAVYFTTVAFLELLDAGNKKRGVQENKDATTSQVIIISSIGGMRRDEKVFSLSYSASKAAVLQLGKTFANTLKAWKIRTNIIAPGLYPSGESVGLFRVKTFVNAALDFAVEMTANLNFNVGADQVPLERAGRPEDMGGLALFLASKAGAYVSGGVHITDGGRLGLFSSTF